MEKVNEHRIFDEEIFGCVRMWVEAEGIRVELRDGLDRSTWHIPWEGLEKMRKELGENRETGER